MGETSAGSKDRPIIFSAPMVRALLDGRKSQARRIFKVPAGSYVEQGRVWAMTDGCAYGDKALPYAPGDRLYVREACSLHRAHGQDFAPGGFDHGKRWGPWSGLPIAVSPDKTQVAYYREGFDRSGPPKWRPSIHMPRWASRITLTVTEVRVQRLQEISAGDSIAEGVECDTCTAMGQSACHGRGCFASIDAYRHLWNSLHGPDAWDANPWVVAVSFTVAKGNIDQVAAF